MFSCAAGRREKLPHLLSDVGRYEQQRSFQVALEAKPSSLQLPDQGAGIISSVNVEQSFRHLLVGETESYLLNAEYNLLIDALVIRV